MTAPLGRRVLAETVGTGFLVAAVIGSGMAAQRLSPGDTGLQLLESAMATGAVLAALILALGHVSASFNPVVSAVTYRRGDPVTGLLAVIAAQVTGAVAGAAVANLMFGQPAIVVATTARSGAGLWLAEAVATMGLVLVIGGTARAGHHLGVAVAVGGFIAGAYWFTSSTSFANPAVTLGRALSDTAAGISPGSVPAFVMAQAVGGALGLLLCRALFPHSLARPEPVRVATPQEVS